MGIAELITQNQYILLILAAWTLPWKGVALWRASQLKQKWWFIILLLINTIGILEILYIFVISRKCCSDKDCGDKCECGHRMKTKRKK